MIVFFDGDCLFCQGSVRFLNRLDRHHRLRFAPLGGETAELHEIDETIDSIAVVSGGEVTRESDAVVEVLLRAGGIAMLAGWVLKVVPKRLRDWGYRLIARHRQRIPVKESCALPEGGLVGKLLP